MRVREESNLLKMLEELTEVIERPTWTPTILPRCSVTTLLKAGTSPAQLPVDLVQLRKILKLPDSPGNAVFQRMLRAS